MNQPNAPETAPPEQPTFQHEEGGGDRNFSLLVAGLLVVIMVTLAALWIIERRKRTDAEKALADQNRQHQHKMQVLGNMLMGKAAAGLDRDSLARVPMQFAGRERDVLVVPPSQARVLGLEPGDLLMVTQSSQASPTTQEGQ